MTFPLTFQLSLIFSGTGSEVLTVMRIHNAVWLGHCMVWYMVMLRRSIAGFSSLVV